MQRATVLAICFGFASLALVAQTNPAPSQNSARPSTSSFVINLPAAACPISMRALQGLGTGLVATRAPEPRNSGSVQRVHLLLANPRSKQIVHARVKVYGLSGKNRIEKTSADLTLHLDPDSGPSQLFRTLDVPLIPESGNETAADLVLHGFTSVTAIHLLAITYSDGSTWAVSTAEECRVAPDPFMLVADR
ncbi:MAG: hypothetical protein WAN28_14360 [Terracidiphilus sp.]